MVKSSKKLKKRRNIHYYANDNTFSKDNNECPIKDAIVCADSLEFLRTLPDNCIDLIFTSPPYNFGKSYDEYDDVSDNEKYISTLFDILKESIRVLKYGGRIAINTMPLMSDFIPTHHMITSFMIENKMIWRNEIIWNKNNRNVHYSCWGSYLSSSSPYMKSMVEFIEVYSKGDIKHFKQPYNSDDMQKLEFSEWVKSNIWNIPGERNMKEWGHPAMFPEAIADRILRLFSFRGDTVMDVFNGVGTTCAVAKRTGRHYIGIDIDKGYCDIAQKRVEETKEEPFELIQEDKNEK